MAVPALIRFVLLAAAPLLLSPTGAGAQDTSAPADPDAEAAGASDGEAAQPDPAALTRAAAEYLAGLDAFAFSWFVSYDEVVDGREKLTFLRSGRNLMLRGTGFASFTEDGADRRDYYHDGAVFTVAAPDENFYASVPFEGSFEDLVDALRARTGTVVPLWSMMSASLPERLSDGIEGSAYLGETRIAGTPVHHLAFATYEEDWQIWISTDPDRPLPLMIVGTETHLQGWPQYRAYLTDWEVEADLDPETFVFVPDEDDEPAALPDLAVAAAERDEEPDE